MVAGADAGEGDGVAEAVGLGPSSSGSVVGPSSSGSAGEDEGVGSARGEAVEDADDPEP